MVITILKNMSSSMGRMTSHIWWKIKHVPNHQPVFDVSNFPVFHVLLGGFKRSHMYCRSLVGNHQRNSTIKQLWYIYIYIYPALCSDMKHCQHRFIFFSKCLPKFTHVWWVILWSSCWWHPFFSSQNPNFCLNPLLLKTAWKPKLYPLVN